MINKLSEIINKKVIQLYLVVYPPFGENDIAQIDISMGYVFEDNPNELFTITTDKDSLTEPFLYSRPIPNQCFVFKEFELRMRNWMNGIQKGYIDTEYYNITDTDSFINILGNKIINIELIKVYGDETPLGLKIIFDKDYVISLPISDGNTIETSLFNKNNNIKHFSKLGKIEYESINKGNISK